MIENHNLINMEKNIFENNIKQDFGLEIKNSEKITKGYSSQVYKANLDNEEVFVRINKDPDVFKVEEVVYKIFEKQGIPVPRIISLIEKPKSIGLPTMIMSGAEGKILKELDIPQEQKDMVYEELGSILKKINETKVKGFGPLVMNDKEITGKFSSWSEYLKSREEHNLKCLNFCLENEFITKEEFDELSDVFEDVYSIEFNESHLLHNDMHHGHFFVEEGKISGIIDLGSLMAGDTRYDIALALFFQKPEQQAYFKKGYGELADDPVVYKYMAVIILQKIFFRSKEDVKGNVSALLPVLEDVLNKI